MKHSKLYSTYKKLGVCVAENELFKTVQFTVLGQKYTVYQSQQIATKETQILPKNCRRKNIPKLILQNHHYSDSKIRQRYHTKR